MKGWQRYHHRTNIRGSLDFLFRWTASWFKVHCPRNAVKRTEFPKEQQSLCWVKFPLTFSSLGTVHCEVSRLICLQSTSLHTWPKHFDLLGMATLPNVDLQRTWRKTQSSFPPPSKILLVNTVGNSPPGQSRALCPSGHPIIQGPPRMTGSSHVSALAIRQGQNPDLQQDRASPYHGQDSASQPTR